MPTLRPPSDYEPTAPAKTWWLYSPNFGYNVKSGMKFPGLFGTEHVWIFALLFVLVLTGEYWGIHTLWTKINKTWVDFLWSLILLDIGLACVTHYYFGQLRLVKNKILVVENRIDRFKLIDKRAVYRLLKTFFTILIFGIAILKIYAFFRIKMGRIDGEMIQWLLIYTTIAFIHAFATGFLIFEIISNTIWWIQKRRMRYSDETIFKVTEPSSHIVSSTIPLKTVDPTSRQPCSAWAGGQKYHVLLITPDSQPNEYTLKSWGVLDDVAVKQLKDFQDNDDQKEKLAIACLKIQLEMLERNAFRPDTSHP
jgi:hypothetical protein